MPVSPDGDREGEGLAGRIGRAGAATGRLALRPVQAVAQAGKDALADEAERAIDGVLAGPLPEAIGRSLVEHRVVQRLSAEVLQTLAAQQGGGPERPAVDLAQAERVLRRVLDDPALERMLVDVIHARLTSELADEIAGSPAFKRLLANVMGSPEVRHALQRQTAGFGSDVANAAAATASRVDDAIEAPVRRRLRRPRAAAPPRYAGLAARGTAFAADAILANLVFLLLGALIGLFASLFGSLRPPWLVDALAGGGWALLVTVYFVGFWSTTGQTPGMRVMRLRVTGGSGAAPSAWRSLVRLVGLALAVIPMFAGFLPVLVDDRRRALQDYLAGTTVVDERDELGEGDR